MTFSRGRSLTEVLIAVVCVCFLLGFVAVLCIGNYYRAKRAMERQKQRRLARLSGQSGAIGAENSPRSIISGSSSAHSEEQRNLLLGGFDRGINLGTQRRRNPDEAPDLLLNTNRPNIQAV
ncbi:hypothetical protein IV203_034872 [Nitzschia inconspicua]|uniref:Uncharacterized protein n=1 Tax=Nitzschia inconspicua TaxID=303405 RepID=A0A9K3L1R8_9STRA|nr:hypothetical protein IV203_002959 [Nitzschia inconspicua]KAG7359774.1 hypothetical protein IV203_034872 [Nitzschia inconspicua]